MARRRSSGGGRDRQPGEAANRPGGSSHSLGGTFSTACRWLPAQYGVCADLRPSPGALRGPLTPWGVRRGRGRSAADRDTAEDSRQAAPPTPAAGTYECHMTLESLGDVAGYSCGRVSADKCREWLSSTVAKVGRSHSTQRSPPCTQGTRTLQAHAGSARVAPSWARAPAFLLAVRPQHAKTRAPKAHPPLIPQAVRETKAIAPRVHA